MAMLLSAFGAKAVGWPANYDGVMLQGFYWDSYKVTGWTNLTSQADELSKYFQLIWIPNSAKSEGGMGYHPIYWFTNHNTDFGTEAELRTMIKTFKEKGTGMIADVIINHRNGVSNWTNFPTETWNGKTYKIGPEGICSGDEVRNASGQATPTGNADTGENWDGARDLDHTNANVQDNCKDYVKCLLTDFGYAGVRYDFVKGYAPQYTKMYNQANSVKYSVGEYWDGSYDAVAAWIEGTGRESAAFDFPFKYQLNKAFNNGAHNYAELVWKANGTTDQPAGMIHSGYGQLAVTFIDNHDTYRDGSKFTGDVLLANAFMLSSPGTPCVFWPHYQQYKTQIQAMIDARRGAGITNTSAVRVLESNGGCYVAEVTGTKGKLFIKMGNSSKTPGDGYTKKASGNGYEIWTTSEGGQGGGGGGTTTGDPVNIYFKNDKGWATPYIHYWGATESDWPGVAMQKDGNVWKYTCPAGTTDILFNAGDGDATKTVEFQAINNHLYSTTADLGEYNGGQGGGGGGTTTTAPATFYVIGEVGGSTWAPDKGVQLTKKDNKFYGDVTVKGKKGEGYFSFAVKLGATWDDINASGNRYVPAADTELTLNSSAPITVCSNPDQAKAYYCADGDYALIVDFDAMTVTLAAKGTVPGGGGGGQGGGGGDDPTSPDHLYIIGDLPDHPWEANYGIEMTKNGDVFTADNVELTTAFQNDYGYFSFASVLGTTPTDWDGDGTTDGLNSGNRYGSTGTAAVPPQPGVDIEVTPGEQLDIVEFKAGVNASACASWKILPGKYNIKADLKNMKLDVTKVGGGSSVAGIEDGFNGEPEYYNMQGIRVYEPEQGIYIVRRGSKVTKEVIR